MSRHSKVIDEVRVGDKHKGQVVVAIMPEGRHTRLIFESGKAKTFAYGTVISIEVPDVGFTPTPQVYYDSDRGMGIGPDHP